MAVSVGGSTAVRDPSDRTTHREEPLDPRKVSATLLSALLLFPACSGGGSTTDGDQAGQESEVPATTPTAEAGPTSEEFIAQADAVCTSSSQESERTVADFGVPKNQKEDFALGKKLLEVRRDRLQKLRALEASEELQDKWDAYLEVRQESFDVIQERYEGLKSGADIDAAELLNQADKLDDEWQSIGEEIGFTACANRLAPGDEKQIEDLITQFFEGEPTKTCSKFVADIYLEYLGGKDGCVENLEPASNISIRDTEGIDKVTANAMVTGSSYGKRASVEITYEDGGYKVRSFYLLD